ncbi:MAG: hypothetical protein R2770_15045 [Acidimicrobiales bacterium]
MVLDDGWALVVVAIVDVVVNSTRSAESELALHDAARPMPINEIANMRSLPTGLLIVTKSSV